MYTPVHRTVYLRGRFDILLLMTVNHHVSFQVENALSPLFTHSPAVTPPSIYMGSISLKDLKYDVRVCIVTSVVHASQKSQSQKDHYAS